MSRQAQFCPGCGAPVHPKATECPECGGVIVRPSRLVPMVAGVVGVMVALAAGLGVWVLLAPPPGGNESAPPQVATAAAPSAPAAPAAEPPAVAAPSAPPAAAPPVAASPAPAAPAPDAQTPLPTVRQPIPSPLADEATRRSFAKATQESFSKNGLDLAVTTGGPDATIITIKFNFPASTAVDLIVGGPFPRQCKIRGFRTIVFTDTNGATWTYDIESEKLTQT